MKKILIPIICLLFAGGMKGTKDALNFHESAVFERLPNLDRSFWGSPANTWKNKYKDYDNSGKVEKFWGSSRWFAWTTDAWHLLDSILWILIVLGVVTYRGDRYIIDFIALKIAFAIGFYLTYTLLF